MIKIQQIFKGLNELRFTNGKDVEGAIWNQLERKFMLWQMLLAFIGMGLFLVVALWIKARLVAEFCLVYMPVILLGTFIFYFAKKIKLFIQLFKILMIVISTVYIVRMGGLFTSGGLFLLAIQAVTSTVILRDIRRTLPVLMVFVLLMFCLIFLEPYFPIDKALDPFQNRIIFIANIVAMTAFMYFFSRYAIQLFSEQEKRETQRQKELNDAKTSLYTNITHEFRTPLTVILGLADTIQKTATEKPIKTQCEMVKKNGRNLLQLVDQMLDLSKMESGKMSVNKIHSNIVPFLRYIFQLQEYYAGEKNITMYFESEKQAYDVEFDPDKTSVIVSNLLSNAIKFTPPGGRVMMKVGIENSFLNLCVQDNGMGIPEELKEKIFDRFYQADDTNTRKAGGAGIGLSLVRELVDLLRGEIDVQSQPGEYTCFTVRLPLTFVSEQKIPSNGVQQPGLILETTNHSIEKETQNEDKQRLMIIEDNSDVLNYLHVCYKDHFFISRAENGIEGYHKAMEEIPDIIISDVMMPEMDGFELCRKLKDDFRTSHIPVILLTAKADISSRIEGLEQGADAYVVKPFNHEELLVRMHKLLELRRKLFDRFSKGFDYPGSSDPLLQKEKRFMKKLNTSIEKYLNDENFCIEILCREMGMSKSQLYRKFKALSNQSVARYIRSRRMHKARQLLNTTSMNISEVGYEVGMKSLSTFSQLFKEEFGKSPRDYLLQSHQKSYN